MAGAHTGQGRKALTRKYKTINHHEEEDTCMSFDSQIQNYQSSLKKQSTSYETNGHTQKRLPLQTTDNHGI
jgi:hypothetical protein